MRVLVWNLGAGSPGLPYDHESVWSYLRDRGDFDFALLQETRKPPRWAKESWASVIWRPKYRSRPGRRALWGCCVLSRAEELMPFEPDERFPWLHELAGSTAVARTSTSPTWLASVHLHSRRIPADILRRLPMEGIEVTTRDGSVWETNVIPHELHRLFEGETFLWGGDLNCDPRMDGLGGGYAGGNRRVFDIWRDAGSIDARARFHEEFQQTFFRSGSRIAFQLDHVFVDSGTEQRLQAWEVDTAPAEVPDALSDHAPIIVSLSDS
jgi:hypothetical protein